MDQKGTMFYGWWIVAATFVVLFAGLCTGFYTVSVFLEPLQATFSWTKTQVSLGFTIAALLVGLLSPVVGILVAKFGIKKVQMAGALITGAGLLLMGSIQQLWQYYAVYIILAVGLASVGLVPAQTVISYWFEKKRGLAMGIIMTGIGLGGMAMVYVASQIVIAADWRWSYRVLGFIVLGVVLLWYFS
ncbi:MAG TPA: MFS transporter [Spirochaetota bacterium]|nr:MFS transporter [Spirochaetota bacterium]